MSDSLPAPPRPSVFPTPSRNPPGPPSSRSVATLLASRGNGATPIPASLQEKMAAVCTLPISVRSCLDTCFLPDGKAGATTIGCRRSNRRI